MAKKKDDEFDLDLDDDSDLDGELDSFGFDDNSATSSKKLDKKTIVKNTLKDVGSGVKDTLNIKALLGKADVMAKAAMPSSLKAEADEIFDAVAEIKKAATESADELRSATTELSQAVKKVLPADHKLVKILSKLEKNTDNDTDRGPSKEELQKREIEEATSSIFDKKDDKQAIVSEMIATTVANKNAKIGNAGINRLVTLTKNILDFQVGVANPYYRRSLELQYKQLFITTEQLSIVRDNHSTFKLQLEAIVKNTSIPDTYKYSEFNNGLKPAIRNLFSNINPIENIKRNMIEKIKSTSEDISGGMRGIAEGLMAGSDMNEMTQGTGLSKGYLAGNMLGDYGRDKLLGYLGNKFAKTGKGKEKVYAAKNAAMDINSFLRDQRDKAEDAEDKEGSLNLNNKFKRLLFSTLSDFTSNSKVNTVQLEKTNMNAASAFDNRAKNSIITVIPTLLTKIYGEVKSIRLKDSKPEQHELYYDDASGSMKSKKAIKESIVKDISNKVNLASAYPVNKITDIIDAYTDKPLSKSEKDIVRKEIIKYMVDDGSLSPDALRKAKFLNRFDNKLRTKLTNGINGALTDAKEKPEILDTIHSSLKTIKQELPDVNSYVTELHKAGLADVGMDLGLITRDERTKELKHSAEGTLNLIADSTNYITDEDSARQNNYMTAEQAKIDAKKADISSKVKTGIEKFKTAAGYDPNKKQKPSLYAKNIATHYKNKANSAINTVKESSEYKDTKSYVNDKLTNTELGKKLTRNAKKAMVYAKQGKRKLNNLIEPSIVQVKKLQEDFLKSSSIKDKSKEALLKYAEKMGFDPESVAQKLEKVESTASRYKNKAIDAYKTLEADVTNNGIIGTAKTYGNTALGKVNDFNVTDKVNNLSSVAIDKVNSVISHKTYGPAEAPKENDPQATALNKLADTIKEYKTATVKYVNDTIDNNKQLVKLKTENTELKTTFTSFKSATSTKFSLLKENVRNTIKDSAADAKKEEDKNGGLKPESKLAKLLKNMKDAEGNSIFDKVKKNLMEKGKTKLIDLASRVKDKYQKEGAKGVIGSILKRTRALDRKMFKSIPKVVKGAAKLGYQGAKTFGKYAYLLPAKYAAKGALGVGKSVVQGLVTEPAEALGRGLANKTINGKEWISSEMSGTIKQPVNEPGDNAEVRMEKTEKARHNSWLSRLTGLGSHEHDFGKVPERGKDKEKKESSILDIFKGGFGKLTTVLGLVASTLFKFPKLFVSALLMLLKGGGKLLSGGLSLAGKAITGIGSMLGLGGAAVAGEGALIGGATLAGEGALAAGGTAAAIGGVGVAEGAAVLGGGALAAKGLAGKTAAAEAKAVTAETKAASAATKVGGKAAPAGSKIMEILKSFKERIVKKVGPKAGVKLTAKLAGKIASRIIPIAGTALLAYDGAMIAKDMIMNKTSLQSAISKQVLGIDLFSDEPVTDDQGKPIKPDEQSEEAAQAATGGNQQGGMWNSIKNGASNVGNAIASAASTAYTATSNALGTAYDATKSAVGSAAASTSTAIGKAYDYSKDLVGKGIGAVSSLFETGKTSTASAAAITNSKGDFGGASYGTYQLSAKQGSLQEYLKASKYGKYFAGLRPGTPEFDAKWKEIAKVDGTNFAADQESYIGKINYNPIAKNLTDSGVDIAKRSKALQSSVWSLGVQFGPGSRAKNNGAIGLIDAAVGNAKLDYKTATDEQIIKAIYKYRQDKNEFLFKSSSPEIRRGTLKRAFDEEKTLLGMLASDPSYKATEPANNLPTKAATAPAQVVAATASITPVVKPGQATNNVTASAGADVAVANNTASVTASDSTSAIVSTVSNPFNNDTNTDTSNKVNTDSGATITAAQSTASIDMSKTTNDLITTGNKIAMQQLKVQMHMAKTLDDILGKLPDSTNISKPVNNDNNAEQVNKLLTSTYNKANGKATGLPDMTIDVRRKIYAI